MPYRAESCIREIADEARTSYAAPNTYGKRPLYPTSRPSFSPSYSNKRRNFQSGRATQGNRPFVPSNNNDLKGRICFGCKMPVHPGVGCFNRPIVCFTCQKPRHKSNVCPDRKKIASTPVASGRPKGRIFVMSRAEADAHPDVVTGMFSIYEIPCLILFDTGASLSFISMRLSDKLPLKASIGESTPISLPSGDVFSCSYVHSNIPISINGSTFPANLLRFPLEEFDIILGMDWLSTHHARFECRDQKIILKSPLGTRVSYQGVRKQTTVKLVSAMKMVKAIRKGHKAFLCVVTTATTSSLPPLKDVPIVREFPDVFLDELPGIPPERDVEFSIELVPGTGPIAKAPYRMAPSELKELKFNLMI